MRFALCELLDHDRGSSCAARRPTRTTRSTLCERHCSPTSAWSTCTCRGAAAPHAAREIRARCLDTEVLAFSGREDPATVVEMLRAGACGYVVKGNGVDELVDALVAAASGQRPLSAQVAEGVVDVLSREARARGRS